MAAGWPGPYGRDPMGPYGQASRASSDLSANSDLTSAFSRDGTKAEEKEQLKNVEYMPFGVFQRKVTMHQVLNNATEFIRGWTPASEEERHGMSPLMSLEGDEARFFHVISSKIVGGHATFQVQMVGKTDVVRTWDAKHMGTPSRLHITMP